MGLHCLSGPLAWPRHGASTPPALVSAPRPRLFHTTTPRGGRVEAPAHLARHVQARGERHQHVLALLLVRKLLHRAPAGVEAADRLLEAGEALGQLLDVLLQLLVQVLQSPKYRNRGIGMVEVSGATVAGRIPVLGQTSTYWGLSSLPRLGSGCCGGRGVWVVGRCRWAVGWVGIQLNTSYPHPHAPTHFLRRGERRGARLEEPLDQPPGVQRGDEWRSRTGPTAGCCSRARRRS